MKKKVVKSCENCEINQNGCLLEYYDGYRKGSCGAWIERKTKL